MPPGVIVTTRNTGRAGSSTPNRPAGLTTVWEHGFTAGTWSSPAAAGTNGSTTGLVSFSNDITGGLTSGTDATAPISADYVRFTYPATFAYGNAPGFYNAWGTSDTAGDGHSYDRLYNAYWMRMAAGNGSTWEMLATYPGIKAGGYWGVATRNLSGGYPADILCFLEADNVNATQWFPRLVTQIAGLADQQIITPLGSLADPYPVKVNTWHRFEWDFQLGTVAGTVTGPVPSGDGRVRCWIDGTLVIDSSTVAFRNASYPRGFWGRHHRPVLGGSGALSKTRVDYCDVSHEIVAVGAQVE